MSITNKRSWIHKARKEREGEGDIPEKFKVIRILRDHFDLHGLTGECICDWEDQALPPKIIEFRFPDIFIKTEQIAIELDGEYHGFGDDLTISDQTVQRNLFYDRLGIQCITLNKKMTQDYDEGLIIECLRLAGLKKIG